MLQNLYIKNYALIKELKVDFSENLNIITGETGAGKSILLGALGLVMGKRADSKVLLSESEKCIVEANFDISNYDLSAILEESEVEYQSMMNVRREISGSSKSRAYINDSLVTLDILETIAENLIDIHQQFDMLEITKEKFQLDVLDALAQHDEALLSYRTDFKQYKSLQSKLAALKNDQNSIEKDLEYNKFLLDEISDAQIKAEEYEQLNSELTLLTSIEDINAVSAQILEGTIRGEYSILPTLSTLIKATNALSNKDPRFIAINQRLINTKEEVNDIVREVESIYEDNEYDQNRINFVQDRIAVLHRLLRKHNINSTSELLQLKDSLEDKVKGMSNIDDQIIKLEKDITLLEKNLFAEAEGLSKKRNSVTAGFCASVETILHDLGMQNAKFQIKFDKSTLLTPSGIDTVSYMFSANKGLPLQTIKNAASGGEISRLSLAISSLVAGAMSMPTMIFDEIDTGVSGDVALKMGAILKKLSLNHQVIAITHSPQISSKADQHFFVYKADEGDKTVTKMKLLDNEERTMEIAKMLSGNSPTEAAIANAKDLLSI
jgi:DNA repair protein RecN (Recombination protein N)